MKEEHINVIKEDIEYHKKEILKLESELDEIKNSCEITKENILKNYEKYVDIKIEEMQDPMWYFNSPPPMVKRIYIYAKDGYYLSDEVEKMVKLYAKEILELKFDS